MSVILFLYDTTEKDLARDFVDSLKEIGVENIKMIPSSPDLGLTLQDKEKHYLDSADGMIFLITPGSERLGQLFPSPSVSDEMGQAKQIFKREPERIMYLVDKECKIQAIDQRCYIPFDRVNIRSVLEAITLLVKNLKQSGLFMEKKTEHKETPYLDIPKLSESIDEKIKQIICVDFANEPDGIISVVNFFNLESKYKLTTKSMNFIKRSLLSKRLVQYTKNGLYLYLTNIGWKLVRYEDAVEKKKEDTFKQGLQEALEQSIIKMLNK